MSSADYNLHPWYTVLELSLIRSHLLWGEFSAFSAANAVFTIFPIFVPPGTHTAGWTEAVWYERFLLNTSIHELTSVIFGNWLITSLAKDRGYVFGSVG